jgi:hypothetical protein
MPRRSRQRYPDEGSLANTFQVFAPGCIDSITTLQIGSRIFFQRVCCSLFRNLGHQYPAREAFEDGRGCR